MIGRNDDCWCGSGKKWKKCHYPQSSNRHEIKDNLYDIYLKKHQIRIKNNHQIDGIRASCHLASRILEETCKMAKAGITTQELNDYAHRLHLKAGALPAPLNYGYPPFPKSICTSINDVICHGIPDNTILKDGDIINIDITCILNGFYGDCSKTVAIGNISAEKQLVMDVSYESLMRSIRILKPGVNLMEIGNEIETYAHSQNCSVVDQFVGHGVGIEFHEGPAIHHNKNNLDISLIPGMTFTIEPMINAGTKEVVVDAKDKWTARTKDGRASAQWEHTILITDNGHEVLTNWT